MARDTTQSAAACCAGGATAGIALLCCLSVGPVLAVLSGLGLGFLLRDAILIPLLVAGLGVTLWGLWLAVRVHGRRAPLGLATAGAPLTVGGVFAAPPVAYVGFALVLAGIAWSLLLVRGVRGRSPSPLSEEIR